MLILEKLKLDNRFELIQKHFKFFSSSSLLVLCKLWFH